jgi:hypothetical protein
MGRGAGARTRHDALLHCGKGGVLGILNAQLAVLQLSLSGSTNLQAIRAQAWPGQAQAGDVCPGMLEVMQQSS